MPRISNRRVSGFVWSSLAMHCDMENSSPNSPVSRPFIQSSKPLPRWRLAEQRMIAMMFECDSRS